MAFDFPNSPSVGQRVTGVGGIVYVWDGVKWASNIGSVTAQSMGDIGRNLIHNPLFNVAQRGVGPWTVLGHTLDRWKIQTNTDAITFNQQAISDLYRTQIGDEEAAVCLANNFVGSAAAGAATYITQKIENVRRLAGKTITVSFWGVCGSGALKVGVSLWQDFGTGGSPSAMVLPNATPVTLSATFARYSVTFVVPNVQGKTLGTNNDHCSWLSFWYTTGATNLALSGGIGVQAGTIWLWGMQLEIGSVATPLEKPDPRYDLANAQRFYCTVNLYISTTMAVAGNQFGVSASLPVTMRNTPTVVVAANANVNTNNLTVTPAGVGSVIAEAINVSGGSGSKININVNCSADL